MPLHNGIATLVATAGPDLLCPTSLWGEVVTEPPNTQALCCGAPGNFQKPVLVSQAGTVLFEVGLDSAAAMATFDMVEKCLWKVLVVWCRQGATLFLSAPGWIAKNPLLSKDSGG